jgi:hypothetical protein
MKEIKLTKTQFTVFNDYDQFQLFTDEDGFADYEDFDEEVDKLFQKFNCIIVTENDYIYGETNGKRELLSDQADDGFMIAIEVIEDFE